MTESYAPYANAIAERKNGIPKQEFMLEEIDLPMPQMKRVVKDAVHKYNNLYYLRPYYSCRYNTPEFMHGKEQLELKSYKKQTCFIFVQ